MYCIQKVSGRSGCIAGAFGWMIHDGMEGGCMRGGFSRLLTIHSRLIILRRSVERSSPWRGVKCSEMIGPRDRMNAMCTFNTYPTDRF